MRQVKLFKGVEVELSALEHEVNEWIRDNKVAVARITGTIAPQSGNRPASPSGSVPSDVLIVVEYEVRRTAST